MKRTWKVGELARLAGLTIRTLRYYDKIGLFSPSAYSEAGHRLYTEADMTRLQQLMSLKELGLSLDEIKAALNGDQFSLFDIIELQITRVKQTLALQQKLLKELEYASGLMARNKALTVEDFTRLLDTMRVSHAKFFAGQRASWTGHLDRLGEFLNETPFNEKDGG